MKKRKVFFFLIFFTATLIVSFLARRLFSVTNIEVVGSSSLRGVHLATGRFMITLDTDRLEAQLLKINPGVQSLMIRKDYPAGLRIVARTSPVVAVLAVADGYFYLSPEGKIVRKGRNLEAKLPAIGYFQKFHFDQYATGETLKFRDITTALYFLQTVPRFGIRVDSVDIKGQDMIVLQSKQGTILLSTSKSTDDQIAQLKDIIKRFTIEGKAFKTLDLRFDKPVVIFGDKK